LRAELQAAIQRAGLEGVVLLRGSVDQRQVAALLGRSSIFVLPAVVAADGDRDGIPNAILEAMAMGLPVVSTPTSGIPEVVREGQTGVLVPAGDAEALADAIGRLLSDPETRSRLGQAGRELVRERFDQIRNAVALLGAWGLAAGPTAGGNETGAVDDP
jgi:glycosyltransferase involved in cell wall biosynthesis